MSSRPGQVTPFHASTTRLNADEMRAVAALIDARGYRRAIELLGTSACTLDKARFGEKMLEVTAQRLRAALAKMAGK